MITELAGCFERTVNFLQVSVADLSDEEMVLQPPGVPNHAAWILGHVIHSCEAIAGELGVPAWLPSQWESQFGYGSQPTAAVSDYPSRSVMQEMLRDACGRLQTALCAMDSARLAEPLTDENVRSILPTNGDAILQILAAHTAYHAGQLAVWRRAVGRASAAVFV